MEVIGKRYYSPPPLPPTGSPRTFTPPPSHFSPPPPRQPSSPPPPHKPSPLPPPSPKVPPPPSPKVAPPPPHLHPPPTPTLVPPPSHAMPPPPLQPAPPSPPHTVIIIVFVSLGGLIFLAFLAAALFCFMKKKKKKMVNETEAVNVEDHIHVHENIVHGPHGEQVVTLCVDEDIKIQEVIKKDEVIVTGSHIPRIVQDGGQATSIAQNKSSSSSS